MKAMQTDDTESVDIRGLAVEEIEGCPSLQRSRGYIVDVCCRNDGRSPQLLWQIFFHQHHARLLDERAVDALCSAILLRGVCRPCLVPDAILFKPLFELSKVLLAPVSTENL
jgi:hypothetical protein